MRKQQQFCRALKRQAIMKIECKGCLHKCRQAPGGAFKIVAGG